MKKINCDLCNTEINVRGRHYNERKNFFCSMDCFTEYRKYNYSINNKRVANNTKPFRMNNDFKLFFLMSELNLEGKELLEVYKCCRRKKLKWKC